MQILRLVYTHRQRHLYVSGTFFVSDTFDLLDVNCKRHLRSALNIFLNRCKSGDVDGACKQSLTLLKSSMP